MEAWTSWWEIAWGELRWEGERRKRGHGGRTGNRVKIAWGELHWEGATTPNFIKNTIVPKNLRAQDLSKSSKFPNPGTWDMHRFVGRV